MATKIRLQRHGRKKRPYYYIVVADSRFKRDGRFIDRLGDYNPLTVPATINLDFDKAFDWVMKGAQPSDTCRKILSYKGVMYKKHLARGLRKGALSEDDMEKKMNEWFDYKADKIAKRVENLEQEKADKKKAKIEAEKKKREEHAAKLEEAAAAADAEVTEVENTVDAENAEAPAEENADAPVVETTEAPAEETPIESADDANEVVSEVPADEVIKETSEEDKKEDE